ncbi:hypothetical protein SteCoe_30325 [Stentor coeruleus]|uniref:Uncharacterized protein n=1 Tax=Stentor coeruleus TaxID=5963 RepID=A0A1R2B3X7_9CILI|nr:hypothetical protein SteCoe_30325 [Stentor coeruleus]
MFWRSIRYLFSGLLRGIDLATDIAYLKLSNFNNIYLYYASIVDIAYLKLSNFNNIYLYYASIVCFFTPAFALTISNFFICCFSARKSNDFCAQLLIFFFQLFLYPTGLSGVFLFSIFICYKSPSPDSNDSEAKAKHNEKMGTVKYIDKTCKIVNLIFKSIPQMAIQVYNNELNNAWTIIAIVSMASSIVSNIATFFSFFSMIDEEIKAGNIDQTSAKVVPINNENMDELEYYPYGYINEIEDKNKVVFIKTTKRDN